MKFDTVLIQLRWWWAAGVCKALLEVKTFKLDNNEQQ